MVVGFAAETGDDHGTSLDYGADKLARKGCDLLVVNRVDDGRAFEVADNAGVILSADGHGPVADSARPQDRAGRRRLRRASPGGWRSRRTVRSRRNDRSAAAHRVRFAPIASRHRRPFCVCAVPFDPSPHIQSAPSTAT